MDSRARPCRRTWYACQPFADGVPLFAWPFPRPLAGHAETLWRDLTELFDVYLLYVFSAFGNMGLEDLVRPAVRASGRCVRTKQAHGQARGCLPLRMHRQPQDS